LRIHKLHGTFRRMISTIANNRTYYPHAVGIG
jgi:hypothetical protein